MRVPIQVIKDSMKTRRSKFLRQSDPALVSLAGEPELPEGDTADAAAAAAAANGNGGGGSGGGSSSNTNNTCNGNNMQQQQQHTATDPEKLQGQLSGHLNGLYNGLTKIMSTTCKLSQDDLKAPFAIEKAIHNIMFIKHHMKRQDEFDAVIKSLLNQIE